MIYRARYRSLDFPYISLSTIDFEADHWIKALVMALQQIEDREPGKFELLQMTKLADGHDRGRRKRT